MSKFEKILKGEAKTLEGKLLRAIYSDLNQSKLSKFEQFYVLNEICVNIVFGMDCEASALKALGGGKRWEIKKKD